MVTKFEQLKGLTLTDISSTEEEMVFKADSGQSYRLYHQQDCCENVMIEDICGDLDDLLNEPLTEAEEIIHAQDINPEGVDVPEYQDSFTWTFYKLSTRKGSVTIRWYGESNGYYSESVDFARI